MDYLKLRPKYAWYTEQLKQGIVRDTIAMSMSMSTVKYDFTTDSWIVIHNIVHNNVAPTYYQILKTLQIATRDS